MSTCQRPVILEGADRYHQRAIPCAALRRLIAWASIRGKSIPEMNQLEYVAPDFPSDAFAGTADYYVRYRLPYPAGFLADLLHRSEVTGKGNLLDLACGPGRLALALTSSFKEVWAVDLEPEMIAAGQLEASRRGVVTIRWSIGRAEDLSLSPASIELITIGEAFHRLDQRLMASRALQWLKPGCCISTLGCFSILSQREPWQRVVMDVVRHWTSSGPEPRRPGVGPDHDERVLRDSGFVDVASYPFAETHDWTIGSIVGYLYSTSLCSRRVLGRNADSFEAALGAALLAHDPVGVYRENIQWGFTLGRKPG
jgi:SAM-dependent methyltransferase